VFRPRAILVTALLLAMPAAAASEWRLSCEGGSCTTAMSEAEGKVIVVEKKIDESCRLGLVHPGWAISTKKIVDIKIIVDEHEYISRELVLSNENSRRLGMPEKMNKAGGSPDGFIYVFQGCEAIRSQSSPRSLRIETKFEVFTFSLDGLTPALAELEAEVARRGQRAKSWPK
jgi:hypothetical protein